MKKVLSMVMAICMLLMLSAGCSQTSSQQGTEQGISSDQTQSKITNKTLNILWASGGGGEYVDYTAEQLEKK